ncbi:hypothetical protein [Clostridium beijerinckii]|uniref:hypothetical protein n=1 Tax=Clostridium beijerinckii TaxID=1520 RepID=UPI001494141C|nr:hypothetical protein [Clostridium beijerinckii]NOW06656.1 hypothetical protein [Clostridium beijerinckii]NYC00200.1 hypothetical protein [Clostridium beijerinckii]
MINSIVEAAKTNKLVLERYLVYLFDNLLKIDLSDSESLENFMPWSDKISYELNFLGYFFIYLNFL